jgi:hypothetical protein
MQQSNPARATTQAPPSNTELRDQIRSAIDAAQDAQRQARDAQLQQRDAQLQQRDAAIAARDAARAAGGPLPPLPPEPPYPIGGTTGQPAGWGDNGIPPQAVDMAIGFFVMCAVIAIGWPLARAFGRRIERRSEKPVINPAMAEQLQRIEQAVDAMSIEIERISESQRFMARLQNAQTPERVGLPADRG